ncbi:MAG: DNA repair protein RecO [bacterium ADurb.Bin212]|nr:MAG: DNA repair protein RecO [bacterium ADurb.Bin212]
MRRIKTRGVVIKRLNFNEADKILTIFTDNLGKIKAIAKGVRKIPSRMAGSLEPYNLIQLELHEGKSFYIVTGVELISSYNCNGMLSGSTKAVYASEIIDKMFEDEEKNINAFELFVSALSQLHRTKNNLPLRLFELQILSQAGFQPDLYLCSSCKNSLKSGENYISNISGHLLCARCGEHFGAATKIEDGVIKLLRLLQKNGVGVCDKIKCDISHIKEVEGILEKYLQNALEKELKSRKYL